MLALAAAAVPAYSSYRLAQDLQELAAQPVTEGLQLRELVHAAGYLSSRGSVLLQWQAPCDAAAPPTRLRLAYQVSHVPGWDHAGSFAWTAQPEGTSAAELRQLMGEGGHLSGQGVLGYDGLLQTRMELPALRFAAGGETLQLAPSHGRLAIGKTALQLDWTLEQLAQQGAGAALEMKQLQLALQLDNRALGTGTFTLDAQQIDTPLLALQGVQLRSETRASGERLRATLSASAQGARLPGQVLNDLKLELSATDVHGPSLQQLAALYAQSCGLRTLSAAASQQLRTALNTLLASGFSLGVSAFQGRSTQGSLDGNLLLQLLPAAAGKAELAQQLHSSGQLRIQGDLLAPEQRQAALDSGWLQQVPGALLARYDYSGGVLQLGTVQQDSSLLQGVLQRLDGMLTAFLQARGAWTPRAAAPEQVDGPNPPSVAIEPVVVSPQ